jgi:1,4-alpha-glucan branching enzyme
VTFRIPAEAGASSAALLGEFSDWAAIPMKPTGDGGHEIDVDLPAGASYRFRYLVDGERWANDWEADDYMPNGYGSDDSVVTVEAVVPEPVDAPPRRPDRATKKPTAQR